MTVVRWPLVVGVIFGIWLSYALYADSLSLPYLQEDVTHLRWLASRSPLAPFLDARGAPAYRPLGKAIVKSWYLLLGHHDRAWLRYQNIGLNALNIALVGLLGSWLDPTAWRAHRGGLAALLFGVFPFAYQAIPWINNFFYPLSVFLLLAMVASYWQGRLRRRNGLLALSLFLAFLAPFEIEYGVMASGLLLAVEVVLWLQGRQSRIWLGGPLLALLLNGLFVARWFTIPKASYSFGVPTAERMMQIATYFLQGLLYPVAPLALPLMSWTGLSDLAAVAVVCLPALALLLVLLLRRGQGPLLVMGLLWFGLLNLPALVFVNFDYVINSPRLLYPPGPGIVWLWSAALVCLAVGERRRVLRVSVASGLLLAALVVSVSFVQRLMDDYHLAETPFHRLTEIAQQAPEDQTLTIVNFPSWITPGARTFALGNHGVQLVPFYIGLDAVIWAHAGTNQPVQALQFTPIRQEQPYFYGMLGDKQDYDGLRSRLPGGGMVYLTEWGADELRLLPAGKVEEGTVGEPAARFGQRIAVDLVQVETAKGVTEMEVAWQLEEAIDQDLTVFVHLYGPDGHLVAQADGYPLKGMAPFWLWDRGQVLLDWRRLEWPAEVSPGTYRIGVGVYDAASGERLPATGAKGAVLADDVAILATLEVQ